MVSHQFPHLIYEEDITNLATTLLVASIMSVRFLLNLCRVSMMLEGQDSRELNKKKRNMWKKRLELLKNIDVYLEIHQFFLIGLRCQSDVHVYHIT